LVVAAAVRDASIVDVSYRRIRDYLDAQPLQLPPRAHRRFRRHRGQHLGARLDQHDTRLAGVDSSKITLEHTSRNLGERTRHLDSRRPGADYHERHPVCDFHLVDFALGRLVRHEDAAPNLDRILERLQPRRRLEPFVVSEVRMRRTGRDDQVVVRHFAVEQLHDLLPCVDRRRFAEKHARIALAPQNPPYRRRDITRIQRRGRYLVEQRLKQMMVAAVDHRQPNGRTLERPRRLDPAEPATDNHDMFYWR
jgi:hypothetical protein